MPYPYSDLREFLEDLKKEGELAEVDAEVDWNLEVGAITRRLSEMGMGRSVKAGGTPAVIFNKIKGYPDYRICAVTHSNVKRVAMMSGHPDPDKATLDDLQDIFLEAMDNPIKPVVVSKKDAPCKENKVFGDDCNLYDLPAPMIHDGDGGRYLCTFHLVSQKDPDTGWTNWGMYRAMIHDRRTMGGIMIPYQQGPSLYFEKYEPRNEPMPFAIAIAPDPLSLFYATCPVPAGVSEMDVIGGARKKPLEVVQCETCDLLVPASSEIVIEGVIPPKVRVHEGPFGEYTGYRASGRALQPVYVVKAITYRNNPILTMSNMGVPVDDCDIACGIGWAAKYKRDLQRDNIPVKSVNVMPEASTNLLVISTKTPYPRMAQRIMATVFTNPVSQFISSFLIVNEDVDVFDPVKVLHALVTRVHPENGVHVYHQTGNPLAPYGSLEERLSLTAPQILYDGTWPVDWPKLNVPPLSSFKTIYPEETQNKVLKRWKEYGLK
jgi:4-hydroxy-3-polyprenylbenzoate decarboxylase